MIIEAVSDLSFVPWLFNQMETSEDANHNRIQDSLQNTEEPILGPHINCVRQTKRLKNEFVDSFVGSDEHRSTNSSLSSASPFQTI